MWVLLGSFFMFSNFYQFYSHLKNHIASSNLRWNVCKNRIENRIFLDLVMVIGSACLLISKLDTWVLPFVSFIEYRVVINIWRCSPNQDLSIFGFMRKVGLWQWSTWYTYMLRNSRERWLFVWFKFGNCVFHILQVVVVGRFFSFKTCLPYMFTTPTIV